MIGIIAQTVTAHVEESKTVLDRIDGLVFVLLAILAGYQKWRASKATGILDAVIIGVETYKATIPKAEAKRVTGIISAVALDGGSESALNKEVKRVTESAVKAYRDDGLPKLALLLSVSLLLGAGGCVSGAIHDGAIQAQVSAKTLRAATVANPAYNAEEQEALKRLWESHERLLRSIEEASR